MNDARRPEAARVLVTDLARAVWPSVRWALDERAHGDGAGAVL